MAQKCPIMARMKEKYESRSQTHLLCGVPVIIRIDGKAFHTYTNHSEKPFDKGLIRDMQQTAVELCKQIQGAKCAITHSDEISILVTDYDTPKTHAWFNYNVQKMVSISASIATAEFNKLRLKRELFENAMKNDDERTKYGDIISEFRLANLDSRAFNIPKDQIKSYFVARQRDAVKNSIQSLAQSLYSQKELENKSENQMQELCFQKGHNWNDLSCFEKRGSFICKVERKFTPNPYKNKRTGEIIQPGETTRKVWEVMEETPMNYTNLFFEQLNLNLF